MLDIQGEILDGRCGQRHGCLLCSARSFTRDKLLAPETIESSRPFVHGSQGFDVGAIEHLPGVPPHLDESNLAKHLEVLRHRRLTQPQFGDDVADRTFRGGEKGQDVAPARLGDGVEDVRCRRGARHESNYIPIREYVKAGSTRARRLLRRQDVYLFY